MPNAAKLPAYVSLLVFKLSWALLVFWQQSFVWLALLLLVASLLYQAKPGQVALRAAFIALVGVSVDQVLTLAGIFTFATPVIPLWLVLLWLHFGLALPTGLVFLGKLPLWARMAVGATAGPLGYWIGASRNGVELAEPLIAVMTLLALLWAVLLPAFLWLATKPFPRQAATALFGVLLSNAPVASKSAVAAESCWMLNGEATYRVLVFSLYKARLHSCSNDFRFPEVVPFQLTLEYQRDISRQQLVSATLDQWRKQDLEPPAHWEQQLHELFPDVKAGDSLALLVDSDYRSYLSLNETRIGTIAEREFSIAMAGIWLAANTSAPQHRNKLIGSEAAE